MVRGERFEEVFSVGERKVENWGKKQETACFTGKRTQSLPWKDNEQDARCAALKGRIAETVLEAVSQGYTRFLTGMALGVDTYAAECVLCLKKEYPFLILEAAVPCANQHEKWREADQARYLRILGQCDKVHCLQERYTPSCMMARNRYMVDRSSLLIAVYDGSGGGTGRTISYAKRAGCRVLELPVTEDAPGMQQAFDE
jgi:uncharacterized phage-like protein YoqJ